MEGPGVSHDSSGRKAVSVRLVGAAGSTLALALFVACGSAVPEGPGAAPSRLGAAPLCEASAARPIACDSDSAVVSCVVVADNEEKRQLFRFGVSNGSALARMEVISLETAVKDIEAVESLGGETLVVVGSHSRKSWRKKKCESDSGRRVIARVSLSPNGFNGSSVATNDTEWQALVHGRCATELLRDANEGAPDLVRRVCGVLSFAEDHAEDSRESCENSFNIEGAVAVPDGAAGRHLWLGLRAPLVDGRAILFRLRTSEKMEFDTLRFDGVALVDLDGWGIRELAYDNEWVWGIAGPMADSALPFRLWRVRAETLVNGASLPQSDVEVVSRQLPSSSEGLAIVGSRGFVVVDGDSPADTGGECGKPALQIEVSTSL